MKNTNIIISISMWCLSLICGFYLGYNLSESKELQDIFLKFTIILLPICFFLTLFTPSTPWLCPILVIFSIAVGIGVDAMTDTTMDRNLWGLEAIMAQAIALPGSAFGGIAGIYLSKKLRKG